MGGANSKKTPILRKEDEINLADCIPWGSKVLATEWVWEHKTQFKDMEQPWAQYTEDLQRVIETAYQQEKPEIEIQINKKQFVIDFKGMRQIAKYNPQKIRIIQRVSRTPRHYYAVTAHGLFEAIPFSEENNHLISTGSGKQVVENGILHTVIMAGALNSKKEYLIDMVHMRQYWRTNRLRYRDIVAVPRSVHEHIKDNTIKRGKLSTDTACYQEILKIFNETKSSKPKINNDALELSAVHFVINPKLLLSFMHQVQIKKRTDSFRVVLAFHGTSDTNINTISEEGFSMEKISSNTRNYGWFGRGLYFTEKVCTSLGYNGGKRLLASLIVLEKTFVVPLPDSQANEYNGKPPKHGYDSHYSPTRKELVVFNPKQILPCFVLELSTEKYDRNSLSDYYGMGSLEKYIELNPDAQVCSCCGRGPKFVCSCGIALYCSEDCQKKHWPNHKAECCFKMAEKSGTLY